VASSLSYAPPATRRVGKETPRLWTLPLRDLTPDTSAGFEAIQFSSDILGIDLHPWQQWLLIHALELNPDRTFRFRTVIVEVARQNGKTTLIQVLALWRMFIDGAGLVIGTAQNLDVAEEAWQGAVEMAEGIPELASEIASVDRTNGKKALRLESGERYKVAAASRRGGRGLSGDLVVLDEIREHQTWDAWGAVTKTTMARERPQIWALSNAGDARSVVLNHLRTLGVATVEHPETSDPSVGLFEWSAADGCDMDDRDSWAQANPSLGYTITEAAISSARATDPEAVFRTEVLCQHVDSLGDVPIPRDKWAAGTDPESRRAGSVVVGLDVSPSLRSAALAVTGWRADGLAHGELVRHEPGVDWLASAAAEFQKKHKPAGFIAHGTPQMKALVPQIEAAGVTITLLTDGDMAAACSQLQSEVAEGGFRHLGDPILADALGNAASKPVGDGGWVWRRKGSEGDITPLVALNAARWGLATVPKAPVPLVAWR
jgi:phage terminase large subunit-like protein